jgi:hypothetical protein
MRRASIEPLSKPSVSARGRSYGASVRRAWLDLWLSVGSMDPISRSMLLLNRGGRFKRRYTHCRHASSPLKRASIDPLVKPSVSARAGSYGASVRRAWLDLWLSVGNMDPISRSMLLLNRGSAFQAPIHALRASLQPSEESLDRPSREAIRQRARSRWRIRHGRRTCNGLPNVLSWCSHCVCRALAPTPAVYNH